MGDDVRVRLGEDEGVSLEWALIYARRYWMHGNEPESQAALTIVARAADPDGLREAIEGLAAEIAVLKPVWEWSYNGPGGADCGDHVGYDWADDQHLADLGAAVEDFYAVLAAHPAPGGGA